MTVKNLFKAAICFSLLFSFSHFVDAGEYTVRPFLIDKEVEPRDVVTETVQLSNDSTYRKYVVYATVNEISLDKNGEIKQFVSPVMTDRSNTVTSWIEVTRGRIEIPPGEQREVPITFRISPNAEAGEYHAFIGFVPAPNRPLAERTAMAGEADGVIIKLSISDMRKETMRVAGFLVNRFVTGEKNQTIDIKVENLGDIASAPTGEVIFYDSRGVEINSLEVNTEGTKVEPGQTLTLQTKIPLEKDMIGRYKANLVLNYGEKQTASLQDTAFFYAIPTNILILVILAVLAVSAFVTYLFKVTFMRNEYAEDVDSVALYVRQGHDPNPMDHDIDLTQKK